ncbi:hypothetical protein R3P38DRAFT_2772374 [Favolaschia claudopus]|uniref:Uncharacterized protein n=1 Tax=Favolaschia claudopus TaxID=2862362 RepID=A0AAW0C610_9AGAR
MAEPACARRMIGGNLGAALLTLKPDWQTAKIRRSATASPNCVMLFGITSDFELTVQVWSKSVVDASYISRRVAEAAGGAKYSKKEEGEPEFPFWETREKNFVFAIIFRNCCKTNGKARLCAPSNQLQVQNNLMLRVVTLFELACQYRICVLHTLACYVPPTWTSTNRKQVVV